MPCKAIFDVYHLARTIFPAQQRRTQQAMFENFDAQILARAQFAFTVSFHIIFPAFSIGTP